MEEPYSVPQITMSFNAGEGNRSSFFRRCIVDQLNGLGPLNHRAVWLEEAHVGGFDDVMMPDVLLKVFINGFTP